MSKDLTNSAVDRQNILNNPYALAEIEKAAGVQGIPFEGKTVVLKEQVAAFFEVTIRTVENYLEQNAEELTRNGYEVLKGNRLKSLKEVIRGMDVPETDFGNIAKTPQLGVFDFRAFLNLAMLVSESERAKLLRQAILDIVIDTINRRTGGGTKYINQRDEDFLHSAFVEENYRKQFTDALKDCVEMGNFKYAVYTDKIYVSTRILADSGRLDDFKRNPQQFIELAAEAINRCKRLALVDGIKYQRLGGEHYYAQALFEQEELTGYLKNMLMDTAKSVYEHVVYDSNTERDFADALEKNDAIKVYAKLPGWFKVPTPLGSYNPDWAVLVEQDGEERLYFVVETKSSLFTDDLRDKESAKIECGRAHFKALAVGDNPAHYEVARSVDDLLTKALARASQG